MTAHKNISGTYHLSVADILQVVYQVCFSPSVEINQDGVAALITTLDRRISDLLDEIIHLSLKVRPTPNGAPCVTRKIRAI